MAANTSISLIGLDFDTLKASLKSYLADQPQFADYDFDGSNMNVLLDLLAYNSYLNAFYLNMVASEMFLDSAQQRDSVVSLAKMLNYTPRSEQSSRAVLTCQFAQSNLQQFEIPSGTRFTGRNSNNSFQFITTEDVVLYATNGYFTTTDLTVSEGSLVTEAFVVNQSVDGQRFIIQNPTVDTSSLEVTVTEDLSTVLEYTQYSDLFGVQSDTKCYFVQACEGGRYELVFGDGVFGRAPKNGAVISVQYRITSGEAGNQCTNFILDDNLGQHNGHSTAIIPTITVTTKSYGGASRESIDSIRYKAPRHFQTQNRAITVSDYKTLVQQQFPEIKSVNVYGGELLSTPTFGKVYLAPATYTTELLSQLRKREIETYLQERCPLGITPTVVDPDNLYVDVDVTVRYDPDNTTLSLVDIASAVQTAIEEYNSANLVDFGITFKRSRLEQAINDSDDSILSNTCDVTIRKVAVVEIGTLHPLAIDFRTELVPGTIQSSSFVSGGRTYQYTDFNPNQNTFQMEQTSSGLRTTNLSPLLYLKDITLPQTVSYTVAGSVNYTTGQLALNQIAIQDLLGKTGVEVTAKPVVDDVQAAANDLLSINITDGISVEVQAV